MARHAGGDKGIPTSPTGGAAFLGATAGILTLTGTSPAAAAAANLRILGENVGYLEVLWMVSLIGALCFAPFAI